MANVKVNPAMVKVMIDSHKDQRVEDAKRVEAARVANRVRAASA